MDDEQLDQIYLAEAYAWSNGMEGRRKGLRAVARAASEEMRELCAKRAIDWYDSASREPIDDVIRALKTKWEGK